MKNSTIRSSNPVYIEPHKVSLNGRRLFFVIYILAWWRLWWGWWFQRPWLRVVTAIVIGVGGKSGGANGCGGYRWWQQLGGPMNAVWESNDGKGDGDEDGCRVMAI